MIVEDFGTRSAWAGVAHLPEVVRLVAPTFVANADDTLFRHTDSVTPDIEGFTVLGINGYSQAVSRKAEPVFGGKKLPGKGNGIFLEVVTEAEVAKHFKERMVAGSIANVIEVIVLATCPDTLLGTDRAIVRSLLSAKEQILELVHTSVREQQRRVLCRNKRTAADDFMLSRREEVEEGLTEFGSFHGQVFG